MKLDVTLAEQELLAAAKAFAEAQATAASLILAAPAYEVRSAEWSGTLADATAKVDWARGALIQAAQLAYCPPGEMREIVEPEAPRVGALMLALAQLYRSCKRGEPTPYEVFRLLQLETLLDQAAGQRVYVECFSSADGLTTGYHSCPDCGQFAVWEKRGNGPWVCRRCIQAEEHAAQALGVVVEG